MNDREALKVLIRP